MPRRWRSDQRPRRPVSAQASHQPSAVRGVLGMGLYFTGLPYVVLWGVLAALLRSVSYPGPVLVAILLNGIGCSPYGVCLSIG